MAEKKEKKVAKTSEKVADKCEKIAKCVTVNCKLLNVRVKPDITSKIVKQVSEGAELENFGKVKGWIKVPDGYVMAEFVS